MKLISGSSELVSQDKFLIQAYQFEEGTPIPDSAQLPNFWKTLSNNKSVEEYRYISNTIIMIDNGIVINNT